MCPEKRTGAGEGQEPGGSGRRLGDLGLRGDLIAPCSSHKGDRGEISGVFTTLTDRKQPSRLSRRPPGPGEIHDWRGRAPRAQAGKHTTYLTGVMTCTWACGLTFCLRGSPPSAGVTSVL